MADSDIYLKLFDTRLVLRDTAEFFRIYSAEDLKSLVHAALHNKKKMPAGIQKLYELERRIAEVRAAISLERDDARE
jgi:hypothetical protein